MKFGLWLVSAVALLMAVPAAAQVYVFGDSFVDSGNANIGSGGLAANPAQGYFQGRFGDGYNFADIVSKRLTGGYATPFLGNGTNFAVGGARAAGDTPNPLGTIPGLDSQRGYYQSIFGANVDPNGTYLIVFGNNDVSAIKNALPPGVTAAQYGALYTSRMVDAVNFLNAGGAGRILLFGVPNPGDPEGVALQAQLDAGLDAISPFLTTPLTRFDYFDFFAKVQAHPTAYGLAANTSFDPADQCNLVRPVTPTGIDCTGFFFFDDVHVTKPVQFEIARAVLSQAGLPTVPEPAVWLQMIAGFGLVGLVARRRSVVAIA
jgi:phospholipase/lecithinase/hemolysin